MATTKSKSKAPTSEAERLAGIARELAQLELHLVKANGILADAKLVHKRETDKLQRARADLLRAVNEPGLYI